MSRRRGRLLIWRRFSLRFRSPITRSYPIIAKAPLPQAVTHVSIYPYREKPFVRIADGVYASCPELCFVQLALVLPLHELLKAGDALCGTFFIDPSSRNGLGSRTP